MSEQTATAEAPASPAPVEAPVADGFIESLESYFNDAPPVQEPSELQEPAAEPAAEEPQSSEEPILGEIETYDEKFKDWTPEAARRFKELKSELKVYKSRAQELEDLASQKESRLKELEALSNNPEYQQLQERIEEYEREMLTTRLEKSYAYKTQIEAPLQNLLSEADTIAEKYSIDSDRLIDAIAETDESAQEEMLSEILASASDRDKFRIYKIIDEVKPILDRRNAIVTNVQEALAEAEELERERERHSLIEWADQRRNASRLVAERVGEKIPFLPSIDGLDLQKVAQTAAETDFRSVDAVTGAYHAIAAQLLPKVAAHVVSLQKELETLTDRLAEYDKASPRIGGSGSGGGGLRGGSGPDGKSFIDAVAAAFGG